jgi:hypothetical protein
VYNPRCPQPSKSQTPTEPIAADSKDRGEADTKSAKKKSKKEKGAKKRKEKCVSGVFAFSVTRAHWQRDRPPGLERRTRKPIGVLIFDATTRVF